MLVPWTTWARYTDKKEKKIFLTFNEIPMGAVAKSYTRKANI
jgi:hypothetical protein